MPVHALELLQLLEPHRKLRPEHAHCVSTQPHMRILFMVRQLSARVRQLSAEKKDTRTEGIRELWHQGWDSLGWEVHR